MAPLQVILLFAAMAAAPTAAFDGVKTISFDEGYVPLFGDGNVIKSGDGRSVKLLLERWSGSGFISSDLYNHGLFSAKIKLPSEYTAGVVVAFYTSNGDIFEKAHDELDFEFLGNIKGREWRVQTNVYGNGSTSRGREERYLLPFDPTKEAHRYSILWSANTIIFYIDETPIREVLRSEAMGGDYPSKPMSLYATIWDGSAWATDGGKHKADYRYAPFVSEFSDLILWGCRTAAPLLQEYPYNSSSTESCTDSDAELAASEFATLTPAKRVAMRRFRERYMTYSFCYDALRYPVALPECDTVELHERFRENGNAKARLDRDRRRRSKQRRRRSPVAAVGQEEI